MSELTIYKEAVTAIKEAILHSRYIAARLANAEQLQLYYRIGRYVSENTRQGKWGTGAIETISQQLQSELPGVRGFSAGNMKKMRLFYEAWPDVLNRSLTANDIKTIGEEPLKLVNPDKITLNRSIPSNDLHTCRVVILC